MSERLEIAESAAAAPDGMNLEQALTSALQYGRDYSAEWYKAYKDKLTDYARFWVLVDLYAMAPYQSIPKKEIIALKRIKPADYLKNLDPELKDENPITVYRGGGEFAGDQRTQVSWTTDPVVAIWFYNRRKETFEYETGGKGLTPETVDKAFEINTFYPAVWQATITKDKIIATIDGGEHEILQHCGVDNIREIKLTEQQLQAALAKRKADVQASNPLLNYE